MDATHRKLATACFNAVWDLLEKPDLTMEETDRMLDLAHASRWHWSQTKDCTPRNLAVGAWQLSRVYAVAGYRDEALHHGHVSLRICHQNDLAPFYEAYAYEALARASDPEDREPFLAAAKDLISRMDDEQGRQAILDDLATI